MPQNVVDTAIITEKNNVTKQQKNRAKTVHILKRILPTV